MGIDLTFKAEGHILNVRVAAIIKHQGYMLCDREDGIEHAYLPGGRIKRGENSARALEREMREELSIDVEAQSPRIITESFYDGIDGRYHEFAFYYLIERPETLPFVPDEICHVHKENGKKFFHRWFEATTQGLANAQVEPQQLHDVFFDLPTTPIHVTINE